MLAFAGVLALVVRDVAPPDASAEDASTPVAAADAGPAVGRSASLEHEQPDEQLRPARPGRRVGAQIIEEVAVDRHTPHAENLRKQLRDGDLGGIGGIDYGGYGGWNGKRRFNDRRGPHDGLSDLGSPLGGPHGRCRELSIQSGSGPATGVAGWAGVVSPGIRSGSGSGPP
jgi:hypothetical protein